MAESQSQQALRDVRKESREVWVLDIAATSHMSTTSEGLENFVAVDHKLDLANDKEASIDGVGELNLRLDYGKNGTRAKLEQTLLVPNL